MNPPFRFTDAPEINDVWQTNLDVDVLIHTRPLLIAERDRFARTYGSLYAANELQFAVYRGLKEYGHAQLPRFRDQLYDHMDAFHTEVGAEALVLYSLLNAPKDMSAKIDDRAQKHFYQTLQTPELIARFVDQILLKLHTLDPIERFHEIFRLRAQHIAQQIPFAPNASQLLADYFQNHSPFLALRSLAPDELPSLSSPQEQILNKALLTDLMHGLIHRLETTPAFLDSILAQWTIPLLHERFHEIDHEIASIQINGKTIDRHTFVTRAKAPAHWLQLAETLGHPVPPPTTAQPNAAP